MLGMVYLVAATAVTAYGVCGYGLHGYGLYIVMACVVMAHGVPRRSNRRQRIRCVALAVYVPVPNNAL